MSFLSVTKSVANATWKEWSAYRFSMMISAFTGPVYFTIQYFIWSAIFATQGTINGFTLNEIIKYFGVLALLRYFTWDQVHNNIADEVRNGTLITYLTRPISHIHYEFSNKIGHRTLAVFLEALPVLLILTLIFRINLMPENIVYTIISVFMAAAMYYLINYTYGLAAFWMTKVHGLNWFMGFFRDLFSGFYLPLVFFPEIVQKLLLFLPFQYAIYVPVAIWTGKYELAGFSFNSLELLGIQFLALVITFFVSRIIWWRAIRRFTGVGA